MRVVLNPSGADLTRGECLEFWTLVDTSITGRSKNPTMIFDFGDVSENSLAFAPETLTIRHNQNGTIDSLFTGRKIQGLDSLNTERDPFSKAFQWPQAGAANLDRVKQALWDGLNGTSQPTPAEQAGGRTAQSARFGDAGPPTAGHVTWTIPTDLPDGTYTYFCRIHPLMRGAFRVETGAAATASTG